VHPAADTGAKVQIPVNLAKDLINTFPGNSSVNTNRGNNRRETVSYAVRVEQKHGDIGSLLPGNAAVNMHPQQWEMVFCVGSVQRSCLKEEWPYEFSSEFSVEDNHGSFVVQEG
jgi:hypothetical protein